MKRFLFATAALLLVNATPLRAQTVAALPQGDGRDLVAVACSQCHTLSVVMAGRGGSVGWRNHVHNMVLRGAQLTPREGDTVLQYLVAKFRPRTPAPGSVTLRGGAGKELVEPRCAVCHSLERVTAVKRPARDWNMIVANMYERLGVSATDEAQAITSYLAAQFGRN